MEISTISNHSISIAVKHLGAELCSLKKLKPDVEYLWNGNPAFWSGHSPILFPIIGGLNDDKYQVNGNFYTLPSHGFLRHSEFTIFEKSDSHICFLLTQNEKTLEVYPFEFEVYVTYTILEKGVSVQFKIKNNDQKTMYFQLGGHPAFHCPALSDKDGTIEDYYIEFEQNETLDRFLKVGKLLTGETEPCLNDENIIKLTNELFDRGAIILKDFESEWVALKRKNSNYCVKVNLKDFTHLGIWTKPSSTKAPFICIEPWFGFDSTAGDGYDITKKEGIIELGNNDVFECEYSIMI